MDLKAEGITDDLKGMVLEIGKGRVLRGGKDVALVGYGNGTNWCLEAANILAKNGISATVVDARFCKPLDATLIRQLAKEHPALITVEEGSIGGFGSHVLQFLALEGMLDGGLKVRPMCLPDFFIEHGTQDEQVKEAGLSAAHIASTALTLLGRPKEVSAGR